MKLSDILALMKNSQTPADWMRVDNENGDGGYMMVCKEDVLLCLSLDLVWKANKPFTRLQITYGPTVVSWADLPVVGADGVPNHAVIMAAAENQLSRLR